MIRSKIFRGCVIYVVLSYIITFNILKHALSEPLHKQDAGVLLLMSPVVCPFVIIGVVLDKTINALGEMVVEEEN